MSSWSALNTLGPVRVAAIHLRAELRCTWCRRRTVLGRREVDHVIPRCEGGTDDPSNLVLACDDCNRRRVRGFLPPRARDAGRTKAEVNTEIKRQTSIDIGPGSAIYPRALAQARIWWPEQFDRRERARAAYVERQALQAEDGDASFEFGRNVEAAA